MKFVQIVKKFRHKWKLIILIFHFDIRTQTIPKWFLCVISSLLGVSKCKQRAFVQTKENFKTFFQEFYESFLPDSSKRDKIKKKVFVDSLPLFSLLSHL